MTRKTRNIRLNIKSTSKASHQKTLLTKIVCGKIGDSHHPRSSLIKYIGTSVTSTPGTKAGTIDVGYAVPSSQVDKVQQHTFKLDLRKNKNQRLGRGDF
jgi:ribosomal protein S17